MKKTLVGVMGAGDKATEIDKQNAYEVGKLIAQEKWVLLSGGRNVGVMDEVNKGAKELGGITIGILPNITNEQTSSYVDIPILTGMGSARNSINVLSSDVIIAIGMGAGTASEIALALKAKKHVLLLSQNEVSIAFFKKIGGEYMHIVSTPLEAIATVKELL